MPIPEQFIPKSYLALKRSLKVTYVFCKYGFFWVAEALELTRYFPRRLRERITSAEEYQLPFAVRLRRVIEELGPTYVKAGQLLSTRPDIIPPDVIQELSKLQDEVPPFPFPEVQEELESELGRPMDTVFRAFARLPIASASIGQVHEAVLHDGREVVVKVQRPGIDKIVAIDVYIMYRIARGAEARFEWARQFNLVERVEEFSKTIRQEMDYTIEGKNADRFRRNFEDNDQVRIPEVYWDHTTRKVLTMEYLHGIPIREKDKLIAKGYDLVAINDIIGRAYVDQILIDGFFHADPHFGNILVMERQVIGLLDFGMVGVVDPIMRRNMARYFIAIVEQDAESLVDVLYEIADVAESTDRDDLVREAGRMLAKYANIKIGQIKLEEIAAELFNIGMKYRITLPGEFTLMDKTLITLEGLGRHLYPEFDLVDAAQPTARMLFRREFDVKETGTALLRSVIDVRDLLSALPRRMNKITQALERGQFKMKLEVENYSGAMEKNARALGRALNRLSLAVVLGALIIAASRLFPPDHGPVAFGMSLGQIIQFSFLAAALVWLLAVFRSGRF
ncbi:MAG: AarF/ABC1/UbiB kinase family protein [bacterium]